MQSSSQSIKRTKPLLGAFVTARVDGLAQERAHQAIDAAFAMVAATHEAMSFHEAESDVSRLNRGAHIAPVRVRRETYEVIARAQLLSATAEDAFDITVAPALVARGLLPRPKDAPKPDDDADWRDIELLPDRRIRFRQPLWIDLGGVAKGYAVDRALEALLQFEPAQACVNAGGDLRVAGPAVERVRLNGGNCENGVPTMELANGALASSAGAAAGAHVDPADPGAVTPNRFVSVVAPQCVEADALTKVVMTRGLASAPCLAAFGAYAIMHDATLGWLELGERPWANPTVNQMEPA
ncbi:MAG TPA: FAD:protein FMN transferase [Parvularculaceae bacterium]|nr:FAD:protein FMN transferase [Parvularculaceae bacterium]